MKTEPRMTPHEAESIGKACKAAEPHNFLIACFAAELAGESYPFSKAMWDILFSSFTDEQLGHKFGEWMGKKEIL